MENTTEKKNDDKATRPNTPRVDVQKIKQSMKVLSSNESLFGIINQVEGGSMIKLDRDEKGVHHYIPLSWVTRVDDKVHLDRTREQGMREWTTAPTK